MKKTVLLFSLGAIALLVGVEAYSQDARARYQIMNLIRKEKLDLILPGAMRDNGVDMWIHAMRRGDPDAFDLDFGATSGWIIFTDRGGDRIERALLGHRFALLADPSVYDIFGEESDLPEFVAEREPKTIAVNMSESLTHADGLSHTQYLKLVEMLGDKYASRLTSSENVITDFRVRRVQREIIAYANISEIQRQIMESAYRHIKPRVTTREDVGWWAQDRQMEKGLWTSLYGMDRFMPWVLHSHVSDPEETNRSDYILQPGDFLNWDTSLRWLNYSTDWKRAAYLLREGETDVPDNIAKAWQHGLDARPVIRRHIKVGRTAGETLKAVVAALEEAGYVYTPFEDTERDREIVAALEDDPRPGISIDCHTVGNTGNSEVAVGPAFSPFRPYRAHLVIQPNNLFSFEYIVHTWMPEWNRRLAINFEDNHIVTANGVEWLYPPIERIILVR